MLPTVLFAVVKLPENHPPVLKKKKIRDQFRWRIHFAGEVKVYGNLPFESGLFFKILASRSTSMGNIFYIWIGISSKAFVHTVPCSLDPLIAGKRLVETTEVEQILRTDNFHQNVDQ